MKKALIGISGFCALTLQGFASDANQMTVVVLLPPQVVAAANTATGTAVDVASYKGNAAFVAVADYTADATRTNAFVLQTSANGTDWRTLTNTAGTAMSYSITSTGTYAFGTSSTLGCDLGRSSKYLRATASRTDGGTNGVSFFMIAPMKSQ